MKKFKGLYVPEFKPKTQSAFCYAIEEKMCHNNDCKKCIFNFDNEKEFKKWLKTQ